MKARDFDIARGVPIAGFTGANGAGKTALAVASCIASMRAGIDCYSTVPIRSGALESKPIESMRHLMQLENCVVLLDEIATIFAARGTNTLPAEAQTFMESLRHRQVICRWTAPAWASCDTVVRRVTQAVATVRPIMRRTVKADPWPRLLVGAVGLMDAMNVAQDAQPDTVLRRRFFLLKNLPSIGAYDTHAEVKMFGMRALHGTCPDCGGTRSRPACKPERHRELGMPWYAD